VTVGEPRGGEYSAGRPRGRALGALGFLALVAALAGGFAYAAFVFPERGIGPKQPIPFSHRIHANVKQIDCRFCHPFVERSKRAGLPEVAKCFYCHTYIIPEHPEIKHERAYYDAGTPVPWVRTMLLPDHVQFRHQPHLLHNFDCSECHGNVKAADRLPQVEFYMGFCIQCHRKNQASVDCWQACHN
jgi:hypothetical protein